MTVKGPRKITDHIVEGDSVNHQLEIAATDDVGAGGANHNYYILGPANGPHSTRDYHTLHFQNGPISENGVNGITQEALLVIIIDRLRCFQKGAFATRENALALTHCEDALHWLQHRTRDRMRRGVEGRTEK
jgi:hypothetical protein